MNHSALMELTETSSQEPPKSKKVQHSNSKNSVLLEAISLIIHMDKYLALESLCNMANSEFSADAVRKHQETVIQALKNELDVSVRQRAVDLLYAMCDSSNAIEIVTEMLDYLKHAVYSIREELVLKIAILAEKYATDYSWYVDTILELIRVGGDFVGEEVWYRVIQVIINRDDIQGYSAKTVFEALQLPDCHENMIKVGGYILGEFGNLIAGDPRSSPMVQFQLLHGKFPLSTVPTKALLLSAYIKFINLFPEIKHYIQEILRSDTNLRNADTELQQRALEYLQLSSIASQDVLATVLEEMPPFPERESSLLAKLKKKKGGAALLGKEKEEEATSNGFPAPAAATPLVDIFDTPPEPAIPIGGDVTVTPGVDQTVRKFVCKNNGVLFENELIQIGIKSEYQNTKGSIKIFYGNKTSYSLTGFTTVLHMNDDLSSKLAGKEEPVPPTIDGGAQMQQSIMLECQCSFTEQPLLIVQFRPEQESQKIFPAIYPIDKDATQTKLLGTGFSYLEGIDPNPENFVLAGVVHTKTFQAGVLLRIEPNKQANVTMVKIRLRHNEDRLKEKKQSNSMLVTSSAKMPKEAKQNNWTSNLSNTELAGIALLALGVYLRVKDNDYSSVFGKGGLSAPANIMIAVGVFVFVISFLGCCGAIKESKCMLVLFIIFIVLVLLCEVALVVLAFVYRSEAKRFATDSITEAIQKTYGESGQSAITKAVDNIQKNFKCCGANNYTDWSGSKWIAKNSGKRVPLSCCVSQSNTVCQNTTSSTTLIFTKNCAAELETWAKDNLAILGGVGAGVVLVELLAIIFAAIIINKSDSVHVA
eukprot:Seg1549.13 transcript_id=Seg1549.13/GoldUCD/mRNA.D3Y31 product="AP-2 complex subunit alpha-2" protein_id=Seg1549.13/GoldUCD/D3Y31